MKVLTVDDDALIRKIIRKELEPAGYQIYEAVNGKDGLSKLSSISNIDLVTLDVEMPVMDGFDVLVQLNEQDFVEKLESVNNANVPVILVTANDTKKVRDKGFHLGSSNFVVKPFGKGELANVVNKILRPNEFFKDLNVMITDDSKTTRQFIVSSIREFGVTIYEADDGISAYELLKKLGDDIDLIISDLNMKRMDGDELCRNVRNKLGMKDVPFIFLSANENRNKILELFKIGATDYIRKPFFKEELLARMQVHLANSKMNKVQTQSISELKAMKRMKSLVTSLFNQDLRPLLQTIVDSGKQLSQASFQIETLPDIANNITSSSQALLYKVNQIYTEIDKIVKEPSAKNKLQNVQKTIMVAEGKKMDMMLLSRLLKDFDCPVETTNTAAQTVEVVQKRIENGSLGLIFLDIDSTEINGITTFAQINRMVDECQYSKKVIVVAMVNVLTASIRHTCKVVGIHEILTKPIKRLQVQTILDKYQY